jgi:tight adherence protein C
MSCVFLLVVFFWPEAKIIDLDKRLGKKVESTRPIKRMLDSLVSFTVKKVTKIKWPWLEKQRGVIKKQLDMAGDPAGMTPDSYIALCVLCAAGVLFAAWFFFGNLNLMHIAAACAMGVLLPRLSLTDKIKKRHNSIVRMLPDVLDLITLSMEAGIDFSSALGKVITKADSNMPLIEELSIMQQGMRLGQSRIIAMKEMIERVQEPNLASVVTGLIQAEQLGSSLGPVLRIQAEEMRTKRFQLAEKIAQTAPVKMLFPLIFFILPSIFVMLFGPMVLQYLSGNLQF